MKELKYQRDAANDLTNKVVKLLNLGGTRHKVVLQAPTGSGKTVITCQALAQIVDTLHESGDSRCQEVAFIWFAPRKLHLQSYARLRQAYAIDRQLTPVMWDEVDQAVGLQPGEILFVNWESVNKDTNLMARESESSVSIYEVARRTRQEQGLPIVAVIDEEHLFWSKTADQSRRVLDQIEPAVEVRVSATPKTKTPYIVPVEPADVIAAGMIKKEVVLNPDITVDMSDERTLNEHLLRTALKKREQLARAYQAQGTSINPLLLIQLPNDTEKMTADDDRVADQVQTYLEATSWNITTANGRLAVWLSKGKTGTEGIERDDSPVQVLLFKEAIALGWDCPRAAVLLIFRRLQSNVFTIQTVGRIMRMPQQRHYADESLNIGYVYTDIAREQIQIIAEHNYLRKDAMIAYRRPGLHNVSLPSAYTERPNAGRNYLGPDFRQTLMRCARDFFGLQKAQASLFTFEQLNELGDQASDFSPLPPSGEETVDENRRRASAKIRLDVTRINARIPADVHFQNREQTLDVQQVKYARTQGEINRVFLAWVNQHGGQFEAKGRTDKIANYLLEMMEEYFGLFDTDAKKVMLYRGNTKPTNNDMFNRLLKIALDTYAQKRKRDLGNQAARRVGHCLWQVPEERVYDSLTHHIKQAPTHALRPFWELDQASHSEQGFVNFLEQNSQYIDWWYKNGDSGQQHYAIAYRNSSGREALFYVDFVVRLSNGEVYLLDTKGQEGEGDIDLEVTNKHNALIAYVQEQQAAGKHLHGSVVKPDKHGNWLYCPFPIENAADTTGWDLFIPRTLASAPASDEQENEQ